MKKLRKGSVFPQSQELRDIIGRHGLDLYDVSSTAEGQPLSWDKINDLSPASELLVGNMYLFIPRPEEGQNLRDAYAVTQGLGPSFQVDEPDDPRWVSLIIHHYEPCHLAVFTRLLFDTTVVVALMPETPDFPDPDLVAVSCETVVDTFEQFFKVVTAEEYGAAVRAAQSY